MIMVMIAKLMIMTFIMAIIDNHDNNCDYMTMNLNRGYDNKFELDYLQGVDMSKGVDGGGDYNYDNKICYNGDGHIDLEGPSGLYKEYIR